MLLGHSFAEELINNWHFHLRILFIKSPNVIEKFSGNKMAVKCQGMIKQKMQCDISGSSVDYVYYHVYTRDPSRLFKQL